MKWTRNSVIVFDFKEALSTTGEAGPYCQYAAVRANSIFRKLPDGALAEALRFTTAAAEAGGDEAAKIAGVFEGEVGVEIWSLAMLAGRLDEAIAQSANAAEPSHLAKYTFSLAHAFNSFYNRPANNILREQDPVRRAALVVVADFVRRQLTSALATLGIDVPERM